MNPSAQQPTGPADAPSRHQRIASIHGRDKVRLRGVISSLVVRPAHATPAVEVELFDGTGVITVFWLGREKITGIAPGVRLEVSGFAAVRGGLPVMYNPRYSILGADDEELET
nr:OB-fold nucleic acid binding domain-containing protein [Helcobacillus sp. ACRRO]